MYRAIIDGHRHEIKGMDEQENHVLCDGSKLVLKPLVPDSFLSLRLRLVSKLRYDGNDWVLGGEKIGGLAVDSLLRRHQNGAARTRMESLAALDQKLSDLTPEDRDKVQGVAWFEERSQEIAGETDESCEELKRSLDDAFGPDRFPKRKPMPPGRRYEPVLLADFGIVGGTRPAAEYFTTIADAAQYAGVSERTIINWKNREWLKVEQKGRKIRIAREELDKCKRGS